MTNNELIIIHDPDWEISYPDDGFLIDNLKHQVSFKINTWQNLPPESLRDKRILIRHPYEYIKTPKAFLTWLERVERIVKKIVNRPLLISKYFSKQYLVNMPASGIHVVPTISLASQHGVDQAIQQNWEEIVSKPILGESSMGIRKVKKEELIAGSYLVQKYIPSIVLGEISIIIVDNIVSHSVIRKVKNIENFTMDWESYHAYNPPPELLNQVKKVLRSDDFSGCYMRLDWIQEGEKFLLSEIEIVDPVLFFGSLETNKLGEVSKKLLELVMK